MVGYTGSTCVRSNSEVGPGSVGADSESDLGLRMDTVADWDSSERPKISALVTSYNVESRIGDCLESLSWCDSILVVDSFSTDSTVEIASSFDKVQVKQHAYYGGAAQKNWALKEIRGDWVLVLDSDEVCTPQLRQEIQDLLLSGPEHDAYQINRRTYFLRKRIRFSGWQHDRVARLFKPGTARYEDRRVHASLVFNGRAPVLKNPMDHFMVDSLVEFVERTAKYAHWGAAQAYRDGRRMSVLDLLVRPIYRFLRTYFLQLGFLDGLRGLMFTMIQATGSFQKVFILLGWQINEARGIRPTDLPEFEDGFEKGAAEPSTAGRVEAFEARRASR